MLIQISTTLNRQTRTVHRLARGLLILVRHGPGEIQGQDRLPRALAVELSSALRPGQPRQAQPVWQRETAYPGLRQRCRRDRQPSDLHPDRSIGHRPSSWRLTTERHAACLRVLMEEGRAARWHRASERAGGELRHALSELRPQIWRGTDTQPRRRDGCRTQKTRRRPLTDESIGSKRRVRSIRTLSQLSA